MATRAIKRYELHDNWVDQVSAIADFGEGGPSLPGEDRVEQVALPYERRVDVAKHTNNIERATQNNDEGVLHQPPVLVVIIK